MELLKIFLIFGLVVATSCYSINYGEFEPIEEDVFSASHYISDILENDAELQRAKRQDNSVSLGAEHSQGGTNLNIEAQRNLYNNGGSSLDATANYNRQFGIGGGPPNYGAGLAFTHRSAINGRSSLDATANYNRQFGNGGGRPNYGAGLIYTQRF